MKRAADITFIIGPPGPEEDKRKFEEWSKKSGKPASEIWVEYVHEILEKLSRLESDQITSKLDELVSHVLNTSVHVREPFLTFMLKGGNACPGIILYMKDITSPNGKQPQVDWSAPAIRDSIGSVFGLIFKSEWVQTFVAYK